jgi:hypothetical protein
MFESCWAHHSTRLSLAFGEPKACSWRAPQLPPFALIRAKGVHRSGKLIPRREGGPHRIKSSYGWQATSNVG